MDWRLWKRAKERLSATPTYSHDWVGTGSESRCRRCYKHYEHEDSQPCRGRPEPIVIDYGMAEEAR